MPNGEISDSGRRGIGLDGALINQINWEQAQKRILVDLPTDFLPVPQFEAIFRCCFDDLKRDLTAELRAGRFAPQTPITADVQKEARVRTLSHMRKKGPHFTRPGSVLFPRDRLLYQIIANFLGPVCEQGLNRSNVFSHKLAEEGPSFFVSSNEQWDAMNEQIASLIEGGAFTVGFKADVSSYFSNINQHLLVNELRSAGGERGIVNLLEELLLRFQSSRSSRGILQGVSPSDIFGTFYLLGVDEFLTDQNITFVRWVDDYYMLFGSYSELEATFGGFVEALRSYDLSLNETKTRIMTPEGLVVSQNQVKLLFKDALEEARENLTYEEEEEEEIETIYGTSTVWSPVVIEPGQEEVELAATIDLLRNANEFPFLQDKIERFTLPILRQGRNSYAIKHVLKNFQNNSEMAKVYFDYISSFFNETAVRKEFEKVFFESVSSLSNYQLMWGLAGLVRANSLEANSLSSLANILNNHKNDIVKGMSAILLAKFGGHSRQRGLVETFANNHSPLVQTAIVYGTQYFNAAERNANLRNWEGVSHLHRYAGKAVREIVART